ncbi:N-acetylmuramoyl-L-alanine amidase [Alteromonas sp. a30]|uniref:N-acetylmuramoyl-L-alanine amidase n=1 Tax=Alteromonas sp. a30 TaxID=2730917 RepID=UPI00227E66B0|nr:peptidoglycan recognition family protein [Alteromonas sp. a30]MCY7295052.1 N-acetylmuramoyl-L-alanine amidase [Alteromonas sp. a30]
MSKNPTLKALCAAISVAFVTAANAGPAEISINETLQSKADQRLASVTQEKLIQQANEKLAKQRVIYQKYFNKAYAAYPSLPQGILESLAFVGSRWEHRVPTDVETHHGKPQTYGLFGLYDTNRVGFNDTLVHVANAYGVSKEEVINNTETHVMATAAFIEQSIVDKGLVGKSIEAYRPIFALFSGIPTDNDINTYAVNSFVFDALHVLERGHDDHNINIPARNVRWENAFNATELRLLNAKGLIIDADSGTISLKGETFGAETARSSANEASRSAAETSSDYSIASTDYGPALWVASPNFSERNDTISHVAIHTMQGSYSGSISWFQNTASSASAHFMVRSSDGQITQMVRESKKAWHARSANPYSIGIEHEGYVSNPAWYTNAMYSASAGITKHICSKYGVNCGNAYSGSAHSGVVELSQSYTVKGHQHFPSQSHTDPGINWDWSRYASLVGGSSSGGGGSSSTTILDSFESSEGHFTNTPAYSGSTTGISTSSTAVRTTSQAKNGIASEQIKLVDNTSTSASWNVRFLSGTGRPSSNTSLTVNNGYVGFWVLSGGTGLSAGLTIDDNDGTEKSINRSIPANKWTFLEWRLDDASQWNAWAGSSDGRIDASSVTLDAIWFSRAQTSYNVYIYIDDVQHNIK